MTHPSHLPRFHHPNHIRDNVKNIKTARDGKSSGKFIPLQNGDDFVMVQVKKQVRMVMS